MTDVVVPQLKGVAKALYGMGEVVSVEGDAAVFALAIGVPLDRAERARPDVERMLAEHLGRPLFLRVVEHDDAGALDATASSSRRGGGAPGAGGAPDAPGPVDGAADHDESAVIDIHALEDANDVAQTSIERLTQVFPGATVVPDDEVTR